MRLATLVPMICAVLLMASCQEATSPVQRLYIDTTVNIMAGQEVRIEILDCLPCV